MSIITFYASSIPITENSHFQPNQSSYSHIKNPEIRWKGLESQSGLWKPRGKQHTTIHQKVQSNSFSNPAVHHHSWAAITPCLKWPVYQGMEQVLMGTHQINISLFYHFSNKMVLVCEPQSEPDCVSTDLRAVKWRNCLPTGHEYR